MWGFSGSLWLLSCNPLSLLNQENPLSESSSESYRENIPILIFPPETRGSERSSARRGSSRGPRGAARLPPRADPGPAQYLARRGPQAGCGRRILRRSRQSRGRAASHAAPSPSRMAPAWAQLGGRPAPGRAAPLSPPDQAAPSPGRSEPEKRPNSASPRGWTPARVSAPQAAAASLLRSSWRPQRSLSSGCHWTFSGLRPRGRYGRPWVCYSP